MTKAHRAVAASQLPAELNDAFASADAKTICRAIGMQHFRIREENGLATSNDLSGVPEQREASKFHYPLSRAQLWTCSSKSFPGANANRLGAAFPQT